MEAVAALGLIGAGIFVWYLLFTGKITIPFGAPKETFNPTTLRGPGG